MFEGIMKNMAALFTLLTFIEYYWLVFRSYWKSDMTIEKVM
jgi:hypothetical protein